MILAEIGDFSRFDSPDKLSAYAGLSPSTYESGKFVATGGYAHMEKRGSRYLRYALFNAAKYVCIWEPSFAAYLAKKGLRASTTTLPFLMLPRNLCGLFSLYKPPAKHFSQPNPNSISTQSALPDA